MALHYVIWLLYYEPIQTGFFGLSVDVAVLLAISGGRGFLHGSWQP